MFASYECFYLHGWVTEGQKFCLCCIVVMSHKAATEKYYLRLQGGVHPTWVVQEGPGVWPQAPRGCRPLYLAQSALEAPLRLGVWVLGLRGRVCPSVCVCPQRCALTLVGCTGRWVGGGLRSCAEAWTSPQGLLTAPVVIVGDGLLCLAQGPGVPVDRVDMTADPGLLGFILAYPKSLQPWQCLSLSSCARGHSWHQARGVLVWIHKQLLVNCSVYKKTKCDRSERFVADTP